MAEGRWTSARLAELYLERIEAVDRGARGTHAIAEPNPDAFREAERLDRERKAGRVRSPLHGVPVVIKDNIDTADAMRTTAGSLALLESKPARDAFLVERLREAGVLLLGKTSLSEWANFRSTRSTSGWSGRGGQVRNPYALDRNPCGSSSGSGVAPSANLCAAAVGTETDGSVICPASFNGIVGLKPTVGLISRTGVIPISHSQDTAGPMGRTVEDVALLLSALAGTDVRDPATAESAGRAAKDYRGALAGGALRGARLGVARNFFGWHPEVDRQMADVLSALAALGAELVDPAEIPHKGDYDDAEYEVLLYEFKQGLNAYLGGLPERGQPRTLAGLIEFNRAHAAEEMPWFGQEIFEKAEAKGSLTDEAYAKALDDCRRLSRAEGLDAVFATHRLDALVCPSMGPAYLTDWVNGDHYGGSATTPAAVSGYPHLTVPAGFVSGLPWGLSFLGPAWSEAKLLGYGHDFERATRARRPPRFLSTLPLAEAR
ncbi:MAG: amidase [Thermoanaerobaculia bacterium]|nr:MAG: amidase [Thermoanaerobaculia bacterium]